MTETSHSAMSDEALDAARLGLRATVAATMEKNAEKPPRSDGLSDPRYEQLCDDVATKRRAAFETLGESVAAILPELRTYLLACVAQIVEERLRVETTVGGIESSLEGLSLLVDAMGVLTLDQSAARAKQIAAKRYPAIISWKEETTP